MPPEAVAYAPLQLGAAMMDPLAATTGMPPMVPPKPVPSASSSSMPTPPPTVTRQKPSPIHIPHPGASGTPLFSSYPAIASSSSPTADYTAVSPTTPLMNMHGFRRPGSTTRSTSDDRVPQTSRSSGGGSHVSGRGRRRSVASAADATPSHAHTRRDSTSALSVSSSVSSSSQPPRNHPSALYSLANSEPGPQSSSDTTFPPPLPPKSLPSFGTLPPGAAPAINPAAQASYELSSSGRYTVLGASPGDLANGYDAPPPLGAIRVPVVQSLGGAAEAMAASPTSSLHPSTGPSGGASDGLFAYVANVDADFTLESISTVTHTKPLVSPALSGRGARRPSAAVNDFFSSKAICDDLPLPPAPSSALPSPQQLDEALQRGNASSSSQLLVDLYTPGPRDGHLLSPVDDGIEAASSESGKRHSLPSDGCSFAAPEDRFSSSASTSVSRHSDGSKWDDYLVEQQQRLQKRLQRMHRRKHILVELVETEATYVNQLQDLVEVYFPIIAARGVFTMQQLVAISSNVQQLMSLHEVLLKSMVTVLQEEGLGSDAALSEEECATIDRIEDRLAEILLNNADQFDLYEAYCSTSASAMNLVRNVQHRPEWNHVESACRSKVAQRSRISLHQMLIEQNPSIKADQLPPSTVSLSPSRLMLRDLLILPVQRVCRYPMMLSACCPTTAAAADTESSTDVATSKIARARDVMASKAARANEAKQQSVMQAATSLLIHRLQDHLLLTRPFLESLGTCSLVGTVEVVYHHSVLAPLMSPVKVRYLGAFLFRGYLIFAKIKRAGQYEVRHYLPLEMFDMVDLTEGFLPHSIRLTTMHRHHFDLAFACADEKDVWAAALLAAKDESVIPPFDLPISVPLVQARPRRESLVQPPHATPKRFSLGATALTADPDSEGANTATVTSASPSMPSSPVLRSMPPMPSTQGPPMTVLLRRASMAYKATIDGFLADITTDQISIARKSVVAMPRAGVLGLDNSPPPTLRSRLSMRDSTVLRRRKSWLTNSTVDRNSFASTVSDMGSRRSIASSLKRGMSLTSHQDFVDYADQSVKLPDDADINADLYQEDEQRRASAKSVKRRSSLLNLAWDRENNRPHPQRTNSMPLESAATGQQSQRGSVGSAIEDESSVAAREDACSGATTPSRYSDYGAGAAGNSLDMYALKATLASMRRQDSAKSSSNLLSRSWSFARTNGQTRSRRNSTDHGSVFEPSAPTSPAMKHAPLEDSSPSVGNSASQSSDMLQTVAETGAESAPLDMSVRASSTGTRARPNRKRSLKILAHLNPFTQISNHGQG